jgi:hypothetical protein
VKLFLVCMIRNEIDILPSFLGHIDSLFDCGCLVDHLSSDGSELLMVDFVSSRTGWEYHSLKTPAFVQAEKSTEFLNRGFSCGADAVFFLDADEFIAGMNRASLERAVAMLETNTLIGHLRWRNCLPVEYRDTFSLDQKMWMCDLAVHIKLVVPRWLYGRYGNQLGMNQGNHSLRVPDAATLSGVALAELLHVPIRSRGQLVRKILAAYVSQAAKPDKVIAPHIQTLFDTLVRRDLTPEVLNALAVNYSTPTTIDQLTHADLEKRGYICGLPDVCRNRCDFSKDSQPPEMKVVEFSRLSLGLGAVREVANLKCAVITPIGPGHELLAKEAQNSVAAAFNRDAGPFDGVEFVPMPDLKGEHGRSRRRNDGIDYAVANKIDWIFFLDADDLMAPDAFRCLSRYIDDYDGIFGLIAELQFGSTKATLRNGQLGASTAIADILQYDPFLTLQMGHFVRTKAAASIRFDESMDTGEDFKYYLSLWKQHRCAKVDEVLFANRRGRHSSGPRSADGGRWRETVKRVIEEFSRENPA